MRPWLAASPPLPEGAIPFGGTDWNQAEVVRGVDGDTVRLLRRRVLAEREDADDLGALVTECWRVRVTQDDEVDLPGGLAGRLVNLDTPERGQPGYKEAAAQLLAWCQLAGPRLRCVTYDTGGGFDRLLCDLYLVGPDGRRQSATEAMLRAGWLPYVKGS